MIYELECNIRKAKKTYRSFRIKPTVKGYVKVNELTPDEIRKSLEDSNRYKDLSFNKAYQVYRILNSNQILIGDDTGNLVHLYPSEYTVVEEMNEKELKDYQKQKKLVKTIDSLIKKSTNG